MYPGQESGSGSGSGSHPQRGNSENRPNPYEYDYAPHQMYDQNAAFPMFPYSETPLPQGSDSSQHLDLDLHRLESYQAYPHPNTPMDSDPRMEYHDHPNFQATPPQDFTFLAPQQQQQAGHYLGGNEGHSAINPIILESSPWFTPSDPSTWAPSLSHHHSSSGQSLEDSSGSTQKQPYQAIDEQPDKKRRMTQAEKMFYKSERQKERGSAKRKSIKGNIDSWKKDLSDWDIQKYRNGIKKYWKAAVIEKTEQSSLLRAEEAMSGCDALRGLVLAGEELYYMKVAVMSREGDFPKGMMDEVNACISSHPENTARLTFQDIKAWLKSKGYVI